VSDRVAVSASRRAHQATAPGSRADQPAHAARCPYCHDDLRISADAPAWVACERCLARHHRACWRESVGCCACGWGGAMERARLPSQRVAVSRWRQGSARLVVPLCVLVLAALGWIGFGLALTEASQADAAARDAEGRVARQASLVAGRIEDAVELRAALEQADAELVALQARYDAQTQADAASIEQLMSQLHAYQAAASRLRTRGEVNLLRAGQHVGEDFALKDGLQAMRSGRYRFALDRFSAALAKQPQDAYVRACRGTARHALGDLEGALEDLNAALWSDPELGVAYYHRGLVHFGLGWLDDARRDLVQARDRLTHESTWDFRVRADKVIDQIDRDQLR
jgi:tetratricopeptide (TPR) repeat protein